MGINHSQMSYRIPKVSFGGIKCKFIYTEYSGIIIISLCENDIQLPPKI